MPPPLYGWGIMQWWPFHLSVRPSLCPVTPMPDPKLRTEGRSKLKIGRREAHDTDDPWPRLEIERSNSKVFNPINAKMENQPYLWKGKAYLWYINADFSTQKPGKSWFCHHLQGVGHIVTVPLQATQLVRHVVPLSLWLSTKSNVVLCCLIDRACCCTMKWMSSAAGVNLSWEVTAAVQIWGLS